MKILMVIFLFFTGAAYAGDFPVIVSMSVVNKENGAADYYIKQAVVDIGPASEAQAPKSGVVWLAHRHYESDQQSLRAVNAMQSSASNYKTPITLGEAAVHLYEVSTGGITMISHIPNSGLRAPTGSECVGYIFATNSNYTWDNVLVPGGCLVVPPADEWCKITTPEILLDHGTITLKNAEGHSASAPMGVSCTTPMSVTFNLISGEPYVYLEPSGQAAITVEDQPLSSKIDLPSGPSTLTVKDMLSGVNTEGVNSGSSVLVMMPY